MKMLEIKDENIRKKDGLERNISPLCPHSAILWCFESFFGFFKWITKNTLK